MRTNHFLKNKQIKKNNKNSKQLKKSRKGTKEKEASNPPETAQQIDFFERNVTRNRAAIEVKKKKQGKKETAIEVRKKDAGP